MPLRGNIFGELPGRFFNEHENWGDYTQVSGFLFMLLDQVRRLVGYPFVIHNAYATSGHAAESKHYQGEAVDFHVKTLSFLDAYKRLNESLILLQVNQRVGFGVYPDWHNPGFHLDVRGTEARWSKVNNMYVRLEDGLQYYRSLNPPIKQ